MLMPALLPEELSRYSKAENETALLQMLRTSPKDFVAFFECAAEDETWSERHGTFMHNAMEWFTVHSLQGRLNTEWIQRVARSIREHYFILRPYLPCNLTFEVQSKSLAVNSLLFMESSEFFHDLIRNRFFGNQAMSISLNELPLDIFEMLQEFVSTGNVVSIWKHDQTALLRILQYATEVRVEGLMHLCADTLKRYLNRDNVVDLLIMSYEKSWKYLRDHCFDFLNEQSWGVKFENPEAYQSAEHSEKKFLVFEFREFSDTALGLFERLKFLITHLTCGGTLIEEAAFSIVIKACPQLRLLNISYTRDFSDRLYEIDPSLQELDLSNCPWLSSDALRKMVAICPNLRRLALTSNVQLAFTGWGALQKLPHLTGLNISRCHQVHDQDFSLILRACPQLYELHLEGCRGLSERAFFELAKRLPQLYVLNVSRCHVSDAALIEIAMRCRNLRELYIARCKEITDKGLLQLMAHAHALKFLDAAACAISPALDETITLLYHKEGI